MFAKYWLGAKWRDCTEAIQTSELGSWVLAISEGRVASFHAFLWSLLSYFIDPKYYKGLLNA